MGERRDGSESAWTRRAWAGALVAGVYRAPLALAQGTKQSASKPSPAKDSPELDPTTAGLLDEVERIGKERGFAAFDRTFRSPFIATGNAHEVFRRDALKICVDLGKAFTLFLHARGFDVKLPDKPTLILVILASRVDYFKFTNIPEEQAKKEEDEDRAIVGGAYDPKNNLFITFDFRKSSRDLAISAARVNTMTLVHEATHMICFNSGLLDRTHDIPTCIGEGLAVYTEAWDPFRKGPFGGVNIYRLQVLADASWIPLERLFDDDEVFHKAETEQLAYAQSWLLMQHYMHDRRTATKLREYLDLLRAQRERAKRVDDAALHLGNLTTLERILKRERDQLLIKSRLR